MVSEVLTTVRAAAEAESSRRNPRPASRVFATGPCHHQQADSDRVQAEEGSSCPQNESILMSYCSMCSR
jgi:hypothetical protein